MNLQPRSYLVHIQNLTSADMTVRTPSSVTSSTNTGPAPEMLHAAFWCMIAPVWGLVFRVQGLGAWCKAALQVSTAAHSAAQQARARALWRHDLPSQAATGGTGDLSVKLGQGWGRAGTHHHGHFVQGGLAVEQHQVPVLQVPLHLVPHLPQRGSWKLCREPQVISDYPIHGGAVQCLQ